MLSISLHGIRIQAPYGLYPQEHILGNEFEVDVDIWMRVNAAEEWPFVDYTVINAKVTEIFHREGQLLETFVRNIHTELKAWQPAAEKIKVLVRKLHPPLPGEVKYSQVCFEG